MLTKEQIQDKLLEDPNWEPVDEMDWPLYNKVYAEMVASGELPSDNLEGDDDEWDMDDDDDEYEDDDDDWDFED